MRKWDRDSSPEKASPYLFRVPLWDGEEGIIF